MPLKKGVYVEPTNQEVFDHGTWVDQWSCDIDFETGETESNGSTEVLVELDDKRYLIQVKHDNSEVRETNKKAIEYTPEIDFPFGD